MPLLTSPIDGSPMKQINRFGIEIDVCPTSAGIWLDKGELEKLMIILKEESGNDQPYSSNQREDVRHSQPRHSDYEGDEDDDDDERHGRSIYDRGKKKKGKMPRMMDIFDF